MSTSQDTEITLGPGKVLAVFFGLVALCALFFGMGYRLGRASVPPGPADQSPPSMVSGGVRPSAAKSSTNATAKPVDKTQADDQPAADAASGGSAPEPAAAPSANAYYVQVAAVSKQEDAEALVDALKRKQYPALATNGAADKLFRVQVGPFGDVKEAEAARAKLVSDGYNPILKK